MWMPLKMEVSMIDRTYKGYYRCKIKHKYLYNDCIKAHATYCTPHMLAMLQHKFSTKKNEAMNHSVATLAQKKKRLFYNNLIAYRIHVVHRCIGGWISWFMDLLLKNQS